MTNRFAIELQPQILDKLMIQVIHKFQLSDRQFSYKTRKILLDIHSNKIATFNNTMSGSESDTQKATEALKRENEKLEEERKRQDKEIADLLKKIRNV